MSGVVRSSVTPDRVAVALSVDDFEVGYITEDGAQRRVPLADAALQAALRACELLGWEDRLVGSANPILTANLRWLAGYRHPRHSIPALAGALRAAFAEPTPLLVGAEAVGDPIAVLPVLFHLLWRHD